MSNILEGLSANGIELQPFVPGYAYFEGLGTLEYLAENITHVSVPVIWGEYHAWDLFRHGYEDRFVGFQFWLSYSPHRLLADQRP